MSRIIFFLLLLICPILLIGQAKLNATKIYDSSIENYVSEIRKKDSEFIAFTRFWIPFRNYSLLGSEDFGIKYSYDFNKRTLSIVKGNFSTKRRIKLNYDFTGSTAFNFYFDKNILAWLSESDVKERIILRMFDFENNRSQENEFTIPKNLLGYDSRYPIILDTDKLMFGKYILNLDNTIDTLKLEKGLTLPSSEAKVFMRRSAFMVDKFFNQREPNVLTSPIDYYMINNATLKMKKISSPIIKISTYRIECNYDSIWLLSNKIYPEKFLLYDMASGKIFPFELDKSIFSINNLSLNEASISDETAPGIDVKFSYLSAMDERSIYIYQIKNGIKLYRVNDYSKIIK